jgi:hypothetical protein
MGIEAILAVVVAISYLAIIVFWITNYFSRIELFILNRLGKWLGLKIRRQGRNWRILNQEHTWQQGCLVALAELVVTFIFMIAPFWVLIGVLFAVFLITGNR